MSSLHLYTGFGPRDRSQVDKEYGRGVYGPDAAEYCIEICKGLINKAVGIQQLVVLDNSLKDLIPIASSEGCFEGH